MTRLGGGGVVTKNFNVKTYSIFFVLLINQFSNLTYFSYHHHRHVYQQEYCLSSHKRFFIYDKPKKKIYVYKYIFTHLINVIIIIIILFLFGKKINLPICDPFPIFHTSQLKSSKSSVFFYLANTKVIIKILHYPSMNKIWKKSRIYFE